MATAPLCLADGHERARLAHDLDCACRDMRPSTPGAAIHE